MIKDLFLLAFKNLKSRGIRSWLTLLGVFIGITAVVSLISLGNGLQLAVASTFGIESNNLITVQAGGISGFGPPGSLAVDPITRDDAEAIGRLSSVENAVVRNIKSASLEYNDILQFRFVGSMPTNNEDLNLIYTQLDVTPEIGRSLKTSDVGKIMIGYNLYNDDSLWGGEKITPGKFIDINGKRFEVIGVFEKKGSLILDNVVSMLENDMDSLFNFGQTADIIVVQPRGDIEKTKLDVEKLLRNRRDVDLGEENFEVSTPEAQLETISDVIGGVQIFIVIVASISILIGAIGIINTMATSVIERRKEIGIAKSIGARNEHIFLQFFIESSLLGLVGGLAGAIFGTLIGFIGINAINGFIGTELTLNIDFILIFLSLLGSSLIGGIAGIVPALRAARQNPVEAIRS